MTEYSEGNDILAMWHLNFQMNHFHKSKVLLAGKCQEPNRKGCKVKPKVKEWDLSEEVWGPKSNENKGNNLP